jgi:hypothetical protein
LQNEQDEQDEWDEQMNGITGMARMNGLLFVLCLTAIVSVSTQPKVGAAAVFTSQPRDWSGHWTTRGPQDIEIVRLAPGTGTARGWNGFVEALLAASKGYRIIIEQTADHVAIAFPGGASNMLTLDMPLGRESSARVVDRGDWWTKHVASARLIDGALDLRSTTFNGWWRNGRPEDAQPRITDFRRHVVLRSGPDDDHLLLRVQLADEKGEVEYVQRFRRAP